MKNAIENAPELNTKSEQLWHYWQILKQEKDPSEKRRLKAILWKIYLPGIQKYCQQQEVELGICAEELQQNIALRFLENIERRSFKTKEDLLLFNGLINNVALSKMKTIKRRENKNSNAWKQDKALQSTPQTEDLLDFWQRQEQQREILEILYSEAERATRGRMRIFGARFLERKNYEEIAREMKISSARVWQIIQKIVQKVNEALEEKEIDVSECFFRD